MTSNSPQSGVPEPIFPGGARGLRIEGLNIDEAGAGKIVVSHADWDFHYTLQPGWRSGILDIHKTSAGVDGLPSHERLFAIRRDDLWRIILRVGEAHLQSVVGLLRPLRIGWLYRRRIAVVRGMVPGSDHELETVLKPAKRRRVEIDSRAIEDKVSVPEYLDEMHEWPDCTFTLHSTRRKRQWKLIGIGFKKVGLVPELRWFRVKDANAAMDGLGNVLMDELKRCAVSDEEFSAAMEATRGP